MSKYKVKKGEEGYVHLLIQRKEFDPKTGKPLFKPYVHVLTPRDLKLFLEHPHGMTINEILHKPKDFEIPQREVKDPKTKKVTKLPYEAMGNIEVASDSPEEERRKELKKLSVAELDIILSGLNLEVDGNKSAKIDSIIESESE